MLTVLCPGKGHLQWTSCLGISCYRAAMWRPSLRDSLEERRGLNHRPHTALVTKQKSPGHIFVYNSKTESDHLGCPTSMETIKLPRSEAIWRQEEFIFRNSSLWPQFFPEWGVSASFLPNSAAFHRAPRGSTSAIPQHTLPQPMTGG